MTASANPSPSRLRSVLTFVLIAAALSAASQPVAPLLARLTEWGLSDLSGRLVLHTLPVLAVIPAVMAGGVLGRGRSTTVRWTIYAVMGFFIGILTSICLDVMVGVPATIAAINGPLREADSIDATLWGAGGLMMFFAATTLAVAALGPKAAAALNFEDDMDPETFDIRRAERRAIGISSLGLAVTGIAFIGLAVMRQSNEGAQFIPALVTGIAGVVSAIVNVILWRGLDELQRQLVVNAYAVSGIFLTTLAFCWAIAHTMKVVPEMDSAMVFVILTAVQFAAVAFASAKTATQGSRVRTA